MEIRYNAFISYRHHPEDIRVATEIHRALEHYRIPKAVRKNQKGNLRLFRDKDELPITSNLSDDITKALEHSDYLIVICSTHTKESIWVQREIETFLRTHTYDKVLTVLVDGEPYDTIPEILQRREEIDPVTGEVTSVPIEPLSCDWRVGKKAAYREELPRLAAALLHCGYDELRQRQRQYKMRRAMTVLGAAMAASLCLMAYFLYTSIVIQKANDDLHAANEEIQRANEEIKEANVQIQSNLDEALRNQSQYLASAARERYEAGDRLTAIALAMAALPSQDNPRPYVPEAEAVLSEALGIYSSRWDISAQGIMDAGALIESFAVSDQGELVYTLDKNNRILVWDAVSYQKIATVQLPDKQRKMDVVGENLLIQLSPSYDGTYASFCCYSPEGQQLWSVMNCADFAVLGENTVMVVNHSLLDGGATIEFFNILTGEKNAEDVFIPLTSSSLSIHGFYKDAFQIGEKILLDGGDWSFDYIYVLDPETGETAVVDPFAQWEEGEISSLQLLAAETTPQGDILAMVSDGTGNMNGNYTNMVITSPAVATVLCFEGETLELKWRQTMTSYSYSAVRTLEVIPETDILICQRNNGLAALNMHTGEIVSECKTMGNILSVFVDDGQVKGLLDDGGSFVYYYETGRCTILQFMDDDLAQAVYTGDYFTLMSNSTHITVYRLPPDPNWESMLELEGYIDWTVLCGDRLAVMADRFCMIDLNAQKLLWVADFEPGYDMESIGFSKDGSKFFIRWRKEILSVNTADGTWTTLTIPTAEDGVEGSVCGFWTAGEDHYYYILKVNKALYLCGMNLLSGEKNSWLLRQGTEDSGWDFGSKTGAARVMGAYVWVWDDGVLYSFEPKQGSFKEVMKELDAYPLCTWHEAENIVSVCTGNEVACFRPNGEEVGRLSLGSQSAASVYLHDHEMLLVSNEGKLLRYDTAGTLLSQCELHLYTSFYSEIVPQDGKELGIRWSFTDDGELILDVFGIANIVDCKQWSCRGYILNHGAYNPLQDTFLCYSDYGRGWFPKYSTEEVLEEGKKQLNGYELPEEKKQSYGIE